MAGSGTAHLREGAILEVRDLVVEYPTSKGKVQAVSGLSFDVMRGETFSLVGESGCGKSSAARAVMMLTPPQSGTVRLDDLSLTALAGKALRRARRRIQMIFQDPAASLNPRRTVGAIVREGAAIQRRRTTESESKALLDSVGLSSDQAWRRKPRELSGGQCQRVAIARALGVEPEVIVADEPVSALDVSVQGQVLNLLADLSDERETSIVFISHDLAVVRQISDRVGVMYLGKLCEVGDAKAVYAAPAHPYTRGLIAAAPIPHPDAKPAPLQIEGDLPSPVNPPPGCRFSTRCPRATDLCGTVEPVVERIGKDHFVACHNPFRDQHVGTPDPAESVLTPADHGELQDLC